MDSKINFLQSTNKDKNVEIISSNSTREEVSNFLSSYINFKGNTLNMTGKMLFELSEDNMKKLGMNLEQRKSTTSKKRAWKWRWRGIYYWYNKK